MESCSERIPEIAKITIGKQENPTWREYHRHRLNAEYFGILEELYQTRRPPSFYNEDFWKAKHGDNEWKHPLPSLEQEWEQEHQKQAMHEYEERTALKVQETGLWIFPNGYGSASPDGIIIDPQNDGLNIGCILIKCPLEVRDMRPIKPALSLKDVDYLAGQINLITTHPFYHEVQGCLVGTEAKWCDFIVWSPNFLVIQRILPDMIWREETFPHINSMFKIYFLRKEDQSIFDYRRNSDMSEVDLSQVFHDPSRAKAKTLKTLIYCIACHIARWIWRMRLGEGHMKYWQEACVDKWDEAKKLICERCLVNNFIYLWRDQNRKEEVLPAEILQITEKRWQIPKEFNDLAAVRVKKLWLKNGISTEPCMCRKW